MNWFDNNPDRLTRRQFIKSTAAAALMIGLSPWKAIAQSEQHAATMRTRAIPSTGEQLPVVGLGTWQQFDVGSEPHLLDPLRQVLSTLFRQGGSVIDTSPMYGNAQSVLGQLLKGKGQKNKAFLATKVWTRGKQRGINQMNASMKKLNVDTVDLMQVHNLVDWQAHLETLRQWKGQGKIRYYGVTHYTGTAFDNLAYVMNQEPLDFVQFPYSVGFRRAENQLLPLAREQDIAVLINRPFQAGGLFRRAGDRALPGWAGDLGINSWAQFFLKFILGHPAVTAVIPGTSNPDHMLDNALAGTGPMPTSSRRRQMVEFWESK